MAITTGNFTYTGDYYTAGNPIWEYVPSSTTVDYGSYTSTTSPLLDYTSYISDHEKLSSADKFKLVGAIQHMERCFFIVGVQEKLLRDDYSEELEERIKQNVIQLRQAIEEFFTLAREILGTEAQDAEALAIAMEQAKKDKKRLGYELGI